MSKFAIATAGAVLLSATLLTSPALAAGDNQGGGQSSNGNGHVGNTDSFSFGVIGDVPYGDAEIQAFPSYIQDLNAHKELSFVAHVGDIKNGSSKCTDEYFNAIKQNFDSFTLPLVYTPGDNEWTDCHRPNNGAYNPLERLAKVREVFFPKPGFTLGAPMKVKSQVQEGFPENVTFRKHQVAFTAVNIPGSNNSTLPWTGLGQTQPTAAQLDEVQKRTDADIQELKDTFRKARNNGDRAVVVMTQADMFDPTIAAPSQADFGAFKPLVQTLIEESNAFGGPVYLINGDSHVFNEDYPLAAGSPWLSFYGQSTAVKNLTRVTVDGSNNAKDWLKVTVNPEGSANVMSFDRVPFTHPAS
ncbi:MULTISPECIES: hypothetical protein [Arthrobacter]|uniref:Calcineurin-like phosphoesterase domain-containing protein n=1 Tax=Arthrobacter terricola TaxID=2547396 RepID=A0A4V2ZS71_9MICC|nr:MULTISPECIES: hypothetical protein [Arthrobacter]MBT8162774.1 hypothetical protein [Arthrobacter sp. GN70]TDF92064.1 hypothetical protein E1809_18970 [Arthrobacter terricola]